MLLEVCIFGRSNYRKPWLMYVLGVQREMGCSSQGRHRPDRGLQHIINWSLGSIPFLSGNRGYKSFEDLILLVDFSMRQCYYECDTFKWYMICYMLLVVERLPIPWPIVDNICDECHYNCPLLTLVQIPTMVLSSLDACESITIAVPCWPSNHTLRETIIFLEGPRSLASLLSN